MDDAKHFTFWEITEIIYILASPILIIGTIIFITIIRRYKLKLLTKINLTLLQLIISMIFTLLYVFIALHVINSLDNLIDKLSDYYKYEIGTYIILLLPSALSILSELTTIPSINFLVKKYSKKI